MDLPAWDASAGSVHTYDWTIPDDPSDFVRVRVLMDNSATDYEDISDADITIAPAAPTVPVLNTWGLVVVAMLVTTAGTITLTRRVSARNARLPTR